VRLEKYTNQTIMSKFKDFFKPVSKEFQAGGTKFGKWMIHGSRLGLMSLFFVSILLFSLFVKPEDLDPQWSFYGVIGFLSSVLLLIIFKTLQHWNDLKHGRSR